MWDTDISDHWLSDRAYGRLYGNHGTAFRRRQYGCDAPFCCFGDGTCNCCICDHDSGKYGTYEEYPVLDEYAGRHIRTGIFLHYRYLRRNYRAGALQSACQYFKSTW